MWDRPFTDNIRHNVWLPFVLIDAQVICMYRLCRLCTLYVPSFLFIFNTDADGSRVSTAFIRICDSVCLSVCTIKPKQLKPKSPNLAQRYLAHQWILCQKVKGQGHGIIKCITSRRDSRAAPSRLVARRQPRCLVQGDRVVGVSYALYRVLFVLISVDVTNKYKH